MKRGHQIVDKPRFNFIAAFTPHFVFPLTCAAGKHLISEKPLNKRFFKGTGVVLAGIECSPKIFDFRANGIPDQERVDFFDTLKAVLSKGRFCVVRFYLYRTSVGIQPVNNCVKQS